MNNSCDDIVANGVAFMQHLLARSSASLMSRKKKNSWCAHVICMLQSLHESADMPSQNMNVLDEVKLANELPLGLLLAKLD